MKYKLKESLKKVRLIIVFCFVAILFSICIFRVSYIITFHKDDYGGDAVALQTREEIIKANRGKILDSSGKVLADTTVGYNVYLKLNTLTSDKAAKKLFYIEKKEKLNSALEILSAVLNIKKEKLYKLSKRQNTRVLIKKNISEKTNKLLQSKIVKRYSSKGEVIQKNNPLIEAEKVEKREYPYSHLASHIIGTVGSNTEGQNGIELFYNKYLAGIDGKKFTEKDVSGNELADITEKKYDVQEGNNVVLTVDLSIQDKIENIIKKAYGDLNPININAMVMEVNTGNIVAMSSYPNYDLNNYSKPLLEKQQEEFKKLSEKKKLEYILNLWRNKNITDTYDPGSVFKLITVASALEEGAINLNSSFNCQGIFELYDRKIRCWIYPEKHGWQNVTEAVANSCNPAMIQITQRLGLKKFYEYLELFGVTEKTGIDFPGEASPQIQNYDKAGPIGLATMSFGQGLSITPIQMLTAVSAILNDGKLMQPKLVTKITDENDNIVVDFKDKVVRKVISKRTAKEVKNIMKYVVNNSVTKAKIDGVSVGGKTGTTQKLGENVQYSDEKLVSSMIIAGPIENPKYAVYVQIDEPENFKTTGESSAPVARDILKEVLGYYNLK
ncbi:MAG: penicillin-binding protein 2 [Clostridiales Family XIII bacterium]|jgi:stage V sporulation protein D (sporulation-specific penicillin-binding protein)|nr:penicillin-binding protein 2 [Clostridiales Family XIII bacterium]